MKIPFAFRAELRRAGAALNRKLQALEAPVWLFHWLMVISFAGAWVTAESERLRLVHVTLGYTMVGLVAFRLVWGLIGRRRTRLLAIVRSPLTLLNTLKTVLQSPANGRSLPNLAGLVAILGLLGLTFAVTLSGWGSYELNLGDWTEELHEATANAMLWIIGVHLVLVAWASWRQRNGRSTPTAPAQSVWRRLFSAQRIVATLVLSAVLGFWWVQWQDAPLTSATQVTRHTDHDD